MFVLIDCNNFFVSCERVFQPALEKVPVAVMSNNDGCIIARSNEVKALGIPMAAPVFKYKSTFEAHKVTLLSSNFALYSDLSRRVMEVLHQYAPEVLVYSIDEAFLILTDLHVRDYTAFGKKLREQVKQWTGIPVSVGIAPTKTLAKIANHYAKKHPECEGVTVLTTAEEITELLKKTDIGDVWGIGWRRTPVLKQYGIGTALQLRDAHPAWVQQNLTITGARTQRELRGESCIELESVRKKAQTIMCTRSFGKKVTEYRDLEEAVAQYTTHAAERLRHAGLACRGLLVYIHTSWFKTTEPRYANSSLATLPEATQYTPALVKAAVHTLQELYKPGYDYHKAGVILVNLVPTTHRQMALYPHIIPRATHRKELEQMQSIDHANHQLGDDSVRLAISGFVHPWKVKSVYRSPRYTTQWNELRQVRA